MSEWQETTLGKEVNLITGFPFKSSQYTNNLHDIRLLRGDNIVQGKLRWDGVKRWSSNDSTINPIYQLREGDVVLAMDRPWIEAGLKFSVISRFDIPSLLVQRVACIRSGNEITKEFLRYLIASKEFTQHILSVETGTAVPHISTSQIKEFSFKLPEVKEQKAIANILSSLDDKIDLLHRQNKTLEAMAETLFRHWFIEEASEDWEEKPLGDVVTISYGKNLPTKNLLSYGYPVFGANGQIGFYDRYSYEEPQVLVSCRGEASGKVNISLPNSFITNNSLTLERNKRPEISFEFLKYWAITYDFKLHVSGSAQPQITIDGLYNAIFTVPNRERIDKFTVIVKSNEEKRLANFKQIQTLEKLRDNLLPKLMSGEVRIKI